MPQQQVINSKRCPDCKTWGPFTAFARNEKRYDGVQSICRECYGVRSAKGRENAEAEGVLGAMTLGAQARFWGNVEKQGGDGSTSGHTTVTAATDRTDDLQSPAD